MRADATAVEGFRPPRQQRSRITVDRIVGATEGLLAERGPEALTVQEIVTRAGTSIGSFYARFDDRDAVLSYVQDRFWSEVEARWDEYLAAPRWEGKRPIQIVTRVIREFVRTMVADASRLRPFLRQALAYPEAELLERTVALDRRIADGVAHLVDATGGDVRSTVPEWMSREGFARVLGAVRDAVVFGGASEDASQKLALSLVRMYGASLELDDLPASWAELLELCIDDLSARFEGGGSPGT